MNEPTRASTGIAYLTFEASLNTDASMIIQQKLDLSGNTTAQTFCENAFDLAAGEDISGALLSDSDITDYNSNNLVYLGSNDVNVQKTFLNNKLNSSIAQNIACNAYEMTLGKNNQIPLVSYLEQEPEPEPEPIPEPEPEPEPEISFNLTTFNIANKRFFDITNSNNGQYIFATGTDGIYRSTDYGQSFSGAYPSTNIHFRGIQCSSNGRYVASCVSQSYGWRLFYSNNYGVTWHYNTSGYSLQNRIEHMDMDDTGTYFIGTSNAGSGGYTGFWTGKNERLGGGMDWNKGRSGYSGGWQNFYHGNSSMRYWGTCSMSRDGKYMLAVHYNKTTIYISSDYGESFDNKKELTHNSSYAGNSAINTSAINDSGQYMIMAEKNNGVWMSTDYGETWNLKFNAVNSSGNLYTISTIVDRVDWRGSAMSRDGSLIVLTGKDDYIYVSKDYGENWYQLTEFGTKDWRKMSINTSNEVYLTEYNGKLYKFNID